MLGKIILSAIALCATAHANIVANVGDKAISDDQIRMEYESATDDQKKAINDDINTRKTIVDNAVNAEVLVMAAKKAGLDKDEEFKAAMERFQRQYLASRFMQKSIESKLGKSELKKFFEENKSFFDSTQVCAHHIVMQDAEEAEKVAKLARTKGVKFEELAKKHSLDPSVQDNKGDLGCFTRDRMVPEFAAAAFSMRKGEIKGPVRSMYGFHVIRVNNIKAGRIPGYEEVEQQVKETYRMKLVSELIQDLRTKSNVKIDEEQVKKFKL